jgi:NADH-quinone oxidoreductase subunit M
MAFASLSHVAMVLIGFASLNQQGLEGGLLQMLNFALTSSALFLLVGGIYQRLGTTEIASMGGLAAPAPLLAAFFLVVGVASVGFPGTSGFVGESLILLGAIRHSLPVGGPAFLGVILSGAGLFWAYERVFLGPVKNASVAAVEDLQLGELSPLLLLAILSIGLGLVPGALQAFTQPSIAALSTRLNEARPLDTVAELTSMLSGTASAAELRETP